MYTACKLCLIDLSLWSWLPLHVCCAEPGSLKNIDNTIPTFSRFLFTHRLCLFMIPLAGEHQLKATDTGERGGMLASRYPLPCITHYQYRHQSRCNSQGQLETSAVICVNKAFLTLTPLLLTRLYSKLSLERLPTRLNHTKQFKWRQISAHLLWNHDLALQFALQAGNFLPLSRWDWQVTTSKTENALSSTDMEFKWGKNSPWPTGWTAGTAWPPACWGTGPWHPHLWRGRVRPHCHRAPSWRGYWWNVCQ